MKFYKFKLIGGTSCSTLPGMVLKDLETGNFKNGTAAPENKDNLR